MKTAKMVQDFNWLCNLDVNHKLVCHGANINTKDHNGVIMCGYTNSSRLELQFKV